MKKKSVLIFLMIAAFVVGATTSVWAHGSQEKRTSAPAAANSASTSTSAAGSTNDFITVTSSHGYSKTVSLLQHAIKSDGLMILGQVNQKSILSMTGLNLQGAHSFFVGNPRVGKKLFDMTTEVTMVIPARISVWVRNGTTYVGYFKPSAMMAMVNSSLTKPGTMLDKKFHQIVQGATQ